MAKNELPPFLDARDIEARYRICNATRVRWEKAKKLPPRDVTIGGRLVGWRESTILAAENLGEVAA